MVNRPHPLALVVSAIIVLGVIAALSVDARVPVWALHSEWVYRTEVGGAVVGLLYLPLVALSLAWRGETFRKMQAPGGAALETPAAQVDSAATKFDEYKSENDAHLARIESAIAKLNDRVERLETPDN
jgi:hypothetical protein